MMDNGQAAKHFADFMVKLFRDTHPLKTPLWFWEEWPRELQIGDRIGLDYFHCDHGIPPQRRAGWETFAPGLYDA